MPSELSDRKEYTMKKQKSIAIVNDLSGFGRCSVTVALPILSAMKISCGILPTAILSNHTEYPTYSMLDFTEYMNSYLENWKTLGFQFDGIYTGFLGSIEQIEIIHNMIKDFHFHQIIIDPVMGDHGKLYDSYTKDMCNGMKNLVRNASIITPNITELCLLTNNEYHENLTEDNIKEMCQIISSWGVNKIVVTGIEQNGLVGNGVFSNEDFFIQYQNIIHPMRPGTGDVFASVIAGCILQNKTLPEAVSTAANFVRICLETSKQWDIPINDGVCFEEHLHLLTK